ncbi:MAG: hypothetical protein GX625_08625 [Clostridiaceae bacterium]|nr:hypothetical protein [Clostridiaceae bacterium]
MFKKNIFKWIQPFLMIIIIIVAVVSVVSMNEFWKNSNDAQPERIKEAIERACVQCYALEGSYPPDLEYLSEHYGLILNEDKYFYYYEIFASNVMPYVEVYERGS